jgi:hypothetical protein
MQNSLLSAQEIAEHQLLAALKLWQQYDYLSALTLAGAAEEILGKRLKKLGRTSSFEQIKNDIVTMAKAYGDTDPKTEKLIGDLLNQTRNELKHYEGEESLSFDLREDAAEMLGRAITNYQLLTGLALEEATIFWEQLDASQ